MAANANWDRWTQASVARHLTDNIATPIKFHFGGKRTAAWEAADHRAEVCIIGFRTKRKRNVEVDVIAIVASNLTANNYTHLDVVGDYRNALSQCINVMDYGATGLVLVGTLTPKSGDADFVDGKNLIPTKTDDRLHSTVNVTLKGKYNL